MLEGVRSFFKSAMFPPDDADAPVRKRDIRLAACALLLELAYADDAFTDDERDHVRRSIRRQYGLDHHQADEMIRMAERHRVKVGDVGAFTALVKEHYTLGQKMVLAEIMWGLVAADGTLVKREEMLADRMCQLLEIEEGYLDEVKRKWEVGDID